MTRDNPTNGGNGQNPTASEPTRIVTTIIGPEATDTAHARADNEEQQGLALVATHGLADSASTIDVTTAIGLAGEATPIMTHLFEQGWAVGTMLLVTGLIAVGSPSIKQLDGVRHWIGGVTAAIGLVMAHTNTVVGVTA